MQMDAYPQQVVVRYQGMPGLLAAIFGCIFGVLGVFGWGLVFVPLAAICSVIAFIRVTTKFNLAAFGTATLALVLTGFGLLTSPSLWIAIGALLVSLGFRNPLGNVYVSQAAQPQVTRRGNLTAQNTAIIFNALQEAEAASMACKNKRLSGELKTYIASAECSNPQIVAAFQKAGYRYMDLIYLFTAKRRALAEQVDRGVLTGAQEEIQTAQFMAWIADEERRRDGAQR